MPDSLMYNEEMFVLLETNQPEQFLTNSQLLEKLEATLTQRQDSLPQDLKQFETVKAQAERLLNTACELEVGPNQFFQWYAVRLEK